MRRGRRANGTYARRAAREARAAIRERSCARAIDHLGLASFYGGRAVGEAARASKSSAKLGEVPRLIAKARRVVMQRCTRGSR